MGDENSVYSKTETGLVFEFQTNKHYVDAFNNQSFNQDDNESATLKIKYYNQPDLIVQHLQLKRKLKKS